MKHLGSFTLALLAAVLLSACGTHITGTTTISSGSYPAIESCQHSDFAFSARREATRSKNCVRVVWG